ncbi:MAG: DNA primase [Bacteroidetes bacterium]|nr:DNA primase [Bacteroidota bacterium]
MENNQMNSSLNSFGGEQGKSNTSHAEILNNLLKQFEKVDFEALAFPQKNELREKLKSLEPESEEAKGLTKKLDKIKVNAKHLLVLSIEQIIEAAKNNRWNLCKHHDFVYLFNGAFWNELDKETLQTFLGEATEKLGVQKFNARFYQFREQLFKQFLSTAYLPTPQTNKADVLMNLKNGTLVISKNGNVNLRAFDSADFLTYQLPFEYDEQSTAPMFQKYLNEVLPDESCRQVLAEYLGYVFMKNGNGNLKLEKALMLYGSGANGKSVMFEIVNTLLGADNVGNYSLQSLTNENGYFRAKIANKLVNYASEINGKLETDVFKQLVSGEPVEARLPYGQPFTLTQYAKLIFNCNELPKEVEHTNAYFRRFLIIPFEVTIPEAEQDKQLHTKIIANELSGVFNWVLAGLQRLLSQKGFTPCDKVKQAVEQYKLESDSVLMFLNENEYQISSSNEMPLKDLFLEYRTYCIESGFKQVSIKNFADRLRKKSYQTRRANFGTVINAEKKSFL